MLIRRNGRLITARLAKFGPAGTTVRLISVQNSEPRIGWKGPSNTAESPSPNATLIEAHNEWERRLMELHW
jgi:hypothetical protein